MTLRVQTVGFVYSVLTLFVAPMSHAAEVTVTMNKMAFQPTELSVAAGTTVTFSNTDTAAHDVISKSDDVFDLKLQKSGESTTHQFARPGVYTILCKFHPAMKTTITVK